jgi:hypothetical protein
MLHHVNSGLEPRKFTAAFAGGLRAERLRAFLDPSLGGNHRNLGGAQIGGDVVKHRRLFGPET